MVVGIIIGLVVGSILGAIGGFKYSITYSVNKIIKTMNFGTIIIDLSDPKSDTLQCEFDKNPREMLDKNYVIMEIKIRE